MDLPIGCDLHRHRQTRSAGSGALRLVATVGSADGRTPPHRVALFSDDENLHFAAQHPAGANTP